MSVEKAKEFLVDTAESEELASRIQESYMASLIEISGELGYDLTEDDIVVAIEEMTGLGDEDEDTEGYGFTIRDSISLLSPRFAVISNPLGLGFGGAGRPGGFNWQGRRGR